jgi:hypothetical protein
VALANHTAHIGRDGCEYVIEASAAPIRTGSDGVEGIVIADLPVMGFFAAATRVSAVH